MWLKLKDQSERGRMLSDKDKVRGWFMYDPREQKRTVAFTLNITGMHGILNMLRIFFYFLIFNENLNNSYTCVSFAMDI